MKKMITLIALSDTLESPSGGRNDIYSDINILEKNEYDVDLLSIYKNGDLRSIADNKDVDHNRISENVIFFSGFQAAERLYAKHGIERFSQFKIINVKDLHFFRELRQEMLLLKKTGHMKILTRELEIYETCNLILSYSDDEINILKKLNPKLNVQKNYYFDPNFTPSNFFRHNKNLIFSGNFNHKPNEDGIIFFIENYISVLKEKKILLEIYGPNSDKLKGINRDEDCIKLMGFVKNSIQVYENGGVFISPIRFGAGIKIKLIEAALCHIPIIATKESIEGLPLEHNKSVLLFDCEKTLNECLNKTTEELKLIASNAYKNISTISNKSIGVKNFNKYIHSFNLN